VPKIFKPIPRQRWCMGMSKQVDHGLMHGLNHLCLHSQHLLKSRRKGWQRVGILVTVVLPIVLSIVGSDMVPYVGHLKYEH
jgi:hypothetical protein